MSAVAHPRGRTLPAPAPIDVDLLRMERDRLLIENDLLRRTVDELTARVAASSAALVAAPPPPPASVTAPTWPDAAPLASLLDPPLFAPGAVPGGEPALRESAPNTGVDFGTVSRLGPDELDELPYGLICLDAQGRVVHYNDTESRLAKLPKDRVIGRNFFSEVAPCTRVREFEGQFYELVRDPARLRVRSFDFIFRFRHSEQHVTIVLTPARTRGLYNMALLRRSVVQR